MSNVEATIVICKCKNTKKSFGVRVEKSGNSDWKYTWAFPIRESSAAREGYDRTVIRGNLIEGEEYPGCPYCGARNFIICSCGRLNCFNGFPARKYTCEWCGITGELGFWGGGEITANGDV